MKKRHRIAYTILFEPISLTREQLNDLLVAVWDWSHGVIKIDKTEGLIVFSTKEKRMDIERHLKGIRKDRPILYEGRYTAVKLQEAIDDADTY